MNPVIIQEAVLASIPQGIQVGVAVTNLHPERTDFCAEGTLVVVLATSNQFQCLLDTKTMTTGTVPLSTNDFKLRCCTFPDMVLSQQVKGAPFGCSKANILKIGEYARSGVATKLINQVKGMFEVTADAEAVHFDVGLTKGSSSASSTTSSSRVSPVHVVQPKTDSADLLESAASSRSLSPMVFSKPNSKAQPLSSTASSRAESPVFAAPEKAGKGTVESLLQQLAEERRLRELAEKRLREVQQATGSGSGPEPLPLPMPSFGGPPPPPPPPPLSIFAKVVNFVTGNKPFAPESLEDAKKKLKPKSSNSGPVAPAGLMNALAQKLAAMNKANKTPDNTSAAKDTNTNNDDEWDEAKDTHDNMHEIAPVVVVWDESVLKQNLVLLEEQVTVMNALADEATTASQNSNIAAVIAAGEKANAVRAKAESIVNSVPKKQPEDEARQVNRSRNEIVTPWLKVCAIVDETIKNLVSKITEQADGAWRTRNTVDDMKTNGNLAAAEAALTELNARVTAVATLIEPIPSSREEHKKAVNSQNSAIRSRDDAAKVVSSMQVTARIQNMYAEVENAFTQVKTFTSKSEGRLANDAADKISHSIAAMQDALKNVQKATPQFVKASDWIERATNMQLEAEMLLRQSASVKKGPPPPPAPRPKPK